MHWCFMEICVIGSNSLTTNPVSRLLDEVYKPTRRGHILFLSSSKRLRITTEKPATTYSLQLFLPYSPLSETLWLRISTLLTLFGLSQTPSLSCTLPKDDSLYSCKSNYDPPKASLSYAQWATAKRRLPPRLDTASTCATGSASSASGASSTRNAFATALRSTGVSRGVCSPTPGLLPGLHAVPTSACLRRSPSRPRLPPCRIPSPLVYAAGTASTSSASSIDDSSASTSPSTSASVTSHVPTRHVYQRSNGEV